MKFSTTDEDDVKKLSQYLEKIESCSSSGNNGCNLCENRGTRKIKKFRNEVSVLPR